MAHIAHFFSGLFVRLIRIHGVVALLAGLCALASMVCVYAGHVATLSVGALSPVVQAAVFVWLVLPGVVMTGVGVLQIATGERRGRFLFVLAFMFTTTFSCAILILWSVS